MPKYVEAALHKFHNPNPMKPQDTSYRWHRPTYGASTECTDPEYNLVALSPE